MVSKSKEKKAEVTDVQIRPKPTQGSNTSLTKLFLVPVFFALVLRYLPHAIYGNVKVYPETVPLSIIDNFLGEDDIQDIQDLIKRERRFATAVEASTGGDLGYVKFMGEQEPVNDEGNCDPQDMFSVDGKMCGFAGRIDIFKHFATTGGFWGAKETIPKLFSSIFTFINYYPELVKDASVMKLFESTSYNTEINKICSAGYKLDETKEMVFHPLQINIVMMPPGQDLPLHQDNQWFWRANQRSVPDWLLHVMLESGLWADEMIPQAQGVAYLHGTKDKPVYEHGGEYVYYPNGPGADPHVIKPKRGQAIIMDGGRTIHGVARTHPGRNVGQYTKGNFNRIEYQGNETWYGLSDERIVDVYQTSDFRQTFVWRGLCFQSEEERQKYLTILEEKSYQPLDEILRILEGDMKKNGKMGASESIESMGFADFGRKLQKVYMQYPLRGNDNTWFPVNYCAAGYKKPWLTKLLSPFCTDDSPKNPLNGKVPPAKQFCDPQSRLRRDTNCPRA